MAGGAGGWSFVRLGCREDDHVASLPTDANIAMPLAPAPDSLMDCDVGHTIYISGPHHVLSNMQNDLPQVLNYWSWAVLRLNHICLLLTRKYYKARILETCFASGPNTADASDIEHFYPHCHDKRWGTTAAAATELLSIFTILVNCWDKQVFLNNGQIEQRDPAHSCIAGID